MTASSAASNEYRPIAEHASGDDPAVLHARIVQLEHQLAQLQTVQLADRKRAEETAQIYEETVTNMLTGLMILQLTTAETPSSLRLIAANPAASSFTGVDLAAMIGMPFIDVFPSAIESRLAAIYAEVASTGGLRDLGEVAYADARVTEGFFSVRAFGLPNQRVCVAFENITERKRAEDVLRQSMLQDEIIRVQAAALAELSTPLIPLNDDVVVMPIIGTVDSRRAQQVMETLLGGIGASGAQVAILDITGVSVVDTQVANVFISAAQAVKLLGAQVVLTGIRPEVAQTLVGLGVDLGGIVTHSSLQRGIAYALGRRARNGARM